MGLILLFFNHEKWKVLYSDNCSLYTTEEWNAKGSPNVLIGMIYLSIGVFCQLLYIPFLFVMSKKEFIQHSCYKFMFLLACIDMIAIPCDSIISGIQCILGLHYCSNPTLFYIVGCGSIGAWLGATLTCILLAIDRFFQMVLPETAKTLFGPRMMCFWLALPLCYMVFYLFCIPGFFNNIYHGYYFDPFYGVEGLQGNPHFYGENLTFLVVNSIAAVVGMGLPYGALCVIITVKSTVFKNPSISKLQRVMLLQSMAICIEMFFVAVVYVGNQFFWVPEFVTKIEHTAWICVHGDTPIVYLMLNASLRKKFFQLIGNFSKNTGKQARNFMTTMVPNQVGPQP